MAETAPVWKLHRSDGSIIEPMLAYADGGAHLNVIPWQHAYLHAGLRFITGSYNPALADAANIDIAVTVGAELSLNAVWEARCGGDAEFRLYRDPSFTVGTPLVPDNRNEDSTNTSTATVVLQPTVSDPGTLIGSPHYVPAGGTGPQSAGGGSEGRDEIILGVGHSYLFRLTNISNAAKPADLDLDWYEHTPVGV